MQFKLNDRVKLVDVKDAHTDICKYKGQTGMVIAVYGADFIDVIMPI